MQASEFLKEPEWVKHAPESIQKEWNTLKEFLLDAFLEKFGIHQDEYDNFNSYMPEILNLIKEHVKIQYLDEIRQELHQIQIRDSCYIKPYDRNYGLDDPEQALLRGNYEGSIRSTIVYTIHTSMNL